MIKAMHHIFIYPLFQWISRLLVKLNFNSINIEGEFNDNGNAVLVVANHISWWDGFWIMVLNLKLIRRRFHFMMLYEQLKKHWYFQYSGGYSIKKKSRNVVYSINYTIGLLSHKQNMVVMFPQGKIYSIYNPNINFEKGIERIVRNIESETQVLFVANLIDYFSDSKPNLYIYLKSHLASDFTNVSVNDEYCKFYSNALTYQENKTS
ncbi:MAG: lysophospholipid acyltransferase family protein [Marinilabiliaceae bacterium]|nr:lysophospholipid acyltransferase family protein [Marinilabiliaceae bacterium]